MDKFYFCKTVTDKESHRVRLRALSGQSFDDGTPIKTDFNIQSDSVVRNSYPVGTVFVTKGLKPLSGYYQAEQIYPILENKDDYKEEAHKPTPEMLDAWEERSGMSRTAEEEKKEAEVRSTRRTYLDKLMKNKDFNVPTVENDGFYCDKDTWYLLVRNILTQVNTMLIGPTGTGKTEIVSLLCERAGIPCHTYDMGSMYDPVASLQGVHRLQKGGTSVFDFARFTKDITEASVVLLDELSRAPVTTNNILFPCLDSRRNLMVEIAGGEDARTIPVNEDCCFVSTANIGSEYTGTMSMDKALVNRFFAIELDYLPADVEVNLLTKRCNVLKSEAKHITGVANSIRKAYKAGDLSSSVSTRETLMVANLVYDGWDTRRAMELGFLNIFEGGDDNSERGVVRKMIMTR